MSDDFDVYNELDSYFEEYMDDENEEAVFDGLFSEEVDLSYIQYTASNNTVKTGISLKLTDEVGDDVVVYLDIDGLYELIDNLKESIEYIEDNDSE